MLFGYFLHNAKSDNPFSLQRTSRFSEPRISAPEQQLLTNKIKTFPKGASRFCKPRFSAQNQNFAQTNLNPFAAPRLSVLFVRHKKYDKKPFVPAGTARFACFFGHFLPNAKSVLLNKPHKKHVSETNIRDVQKGEIHAIRAVLWEANRPKPFRCRFKVMLFRCHPWR